MHAKLGEWFPMVRSHEPLEPSATWREKSIDVSLYPCHIWFVSFNAFKESEVNTRSLEAWPLKFISWCR